MRLHSLGAAVAVAAVLSVATPARAQMISMPPAKTAVPVVLWGVTGAVIGAVAWPMMFPASVGATAAPGAGMAIAWTWGSFLTTRAAVGTVLGGALGYAIAPN